MCHRRSFLKLALGCVGVLAAGHSALAAGSVNAGKKSKTTWYAKVYVKDRAKLIGHFGTHSEAYIAGKRWANTHGANFYGETIKKDLD